PQDVSGGGVDLVMKVASALTAAQQQGQAGECTCHYLSPQDCPHVPHRTAPDTRPHAQPMQQGGREALARGWLHRHGPGDDYDLHDESSGAGKDCAKCVPCVILRADTAPPSAPVGFPVEVSVGDKRIPLSGHDMLRALAQQPAAVALTRKYP